jgi:hypothetical protein
MLKQFIKATQEITIPLDEYAQLVDDQRFLNALRNAGVDNWDGYSFALEELDGNR